MFEQSVLAGHPTNKGLSFVASLGVEVLLLAITILIPLIYTNQLPLIQLATPLRLPLAPPPPLARKQAVARGLEEHSATPKPFIAPPAIPERVAKIVDEPGASEPPSINATGVQGGTGPAAGGDAFSRLAGNPPSPPPARTETHKPTAPGGPVRMSKGVQEAKIVRRIIPVYPELAKQARISGTVHLIGVIAKDGTIQNLRVISGHPLLVKAAVDAVRQWVYQPTRLNGEPVEVICPIDVTFKLN